MPARCLAIVDRAYRGGVETQYADTLYLARELNRQLAGLDLLLRGLAVGYAVSTAPPPPLRLAGHLVDSLPDPRRSVRTLLDEGVGVWVEEPDLVGLGPTAGERLLPGVGRVEPGELALRWPDYERVWFL